MCERCDERDKMTEIMNGSSEKSSQSCSLKKPSLKDIEEEEFKNWYNSIVKLSTQLRECILSSASFNERMFNLYQQLTKLDLKKDREQIVQILKMIVDYGRMQELDVNVARRTAEMILDKVRGNG